MILPIFYKLNYKGQKEIHIFRAPESFFSEIKDIEPLCKVPTDSEDETNIEFLMIFVKEQIVLNEYAKSLIPNTIGNAVIWFVYPKKSSKKYKFDFDRDKGWEVLGQMGLEPVRMVAVDTDWSALRFKKVEFIKKMTRQFAKTETGKEKAENSKKIFTNKKGT